MKRILIISAALLMLCSYAEARKVTGTVTSGEEKLSGVIVTDGKNFTQTKKNGKFSFEIEDDAEFVYIVTPSGYTADFSSGVPAFYQEAAGKTKFVFELIPTDKSGDYTLVAIADPQFKTDKHFSQFAGAPMDDLCATTKALKGAAAGVVLGDICYDNFELWDGYKKEIVRTGIPFYPAPGNHDHDYKADGDLNAIKAYRKMFGPENYAFFLGKDVVIVLDNILYTTAKKYTEGYTESVLSWLKSLVNILPEDAELYIAQHSPLKMLRRGKTIGGMSDMLDIVRGRKVTFLSGHEHVNNVIDYEENITEHNVAAFCGSWWDADHCTDGTPRGYKVFTKNTGKTEWYYKSIGHDKNHQIELYKPGQTPMHPNSVVVNVWDWDPSWKVEWFEDGKSMGKLKPVYEYSPVYIREINEAFPDGNISEHKKAGLNFHYFAATPSQYAKNVTIAVESRFGQKWVYNVDMSDYVDVQAHRGGAALMPENTIEAMKYALDMGVNTLELDLHISEDGQIVVSHDPYFHHRYAIRPDGSHVKKEEPKEYLYQMPYSEIVKYDVGSRPVGHWPEKKCFPTVKPLAEDLINEVEKYVKEKGYSPVRYNIEVKSKKMNGEGQLIPTYDVFATMCCKFLISKHLGDRLVVQCFDPRALNYMNEKYPELIYSYLVDEDAPDFDTVMGMLNFTPKWLSPNHNLVNEEFVKKCKEKGMKIVPWTVDDPKEIKRLIDLDVDAIISNYPDRVLMQTRGFAFPK